MQSTDVNKIFVTKLVLKKLKLTRLKLTTSSQDLRLNFFSFPVDDDKLSHGEI